MLYVVKCLVIFLITLEKIFWALKFEIAGSAQPRLHLLLLGEIALGNLGVEAIVAS